jgi:hypothetical protein
MPGNTPLPAFNRKPSSYVLKVKSKVGRVVKGTNFVILRDAGEPVQVASRYEQGGADELVFLDITTSHEQRDIMIDVVRRTAEQVFMPLTVGGGIRTIEDIRSLLRAGCDKVIQVMQSITYVIRPPRVKMRLKIRLTFHRVLPRSPPPYSATPLTLAVCRQHVTGLADL